MEECSLEGALWRRVVDHKYGSMWGGWCLIGSQALYEMSLWKNIRKDWDSFLCFTSCKVDDGPRIQWHDSWCGG